MKELSIEEKARRYDEVIESAKGCLKDGTITSTAISYIEKIFHELKESEDERIRRGLINGFRFYSDQEYWGTEKFPLKIKDILAWLEKQGEQKPAEPTDLRTWKYIVDAVLTEREGIGNYLDNPWTTEVAEKLKKRFGTIEPKPVEWSREDEQFLLVCKNALAKYQVSDKWDAGIISRWLENRLKSLRPQK